MKDTVKSSPLRDGGSQVRAFVTSGSPAAQRLLMAAVLMALALLIERATLPSLVLRIFQPGGPGATLDDPCSGIPLPC
jgi:hypothetical protein